VNSDQDHVHRLRALIARGMANPQDELDLRLLLLSLYGRRRKMVELDNPDRQCEENDEIENSSLLSKEPSSSSAVIVEDDGIGEDQQKIH
jgi:hypothetical protein